MAKRRKQSFDDDQAFVQSFYDPSVFGSVFGEAPPVSVDPDFVTWFDYQEPDNSKAIKVFNWFDYTLVGEFPAPTKTSSFGHPQEFTSLMGTEKTLFGLFNHIDSMGNYDPETMVALDPSTFQVIAGPVATPTDRNAIGFGGGDGRSYFSSSLPSRAWRATPTFDGATQLGGASGLASLVSYFAENNFCTIQSFQGHTYQINPDTGALIDTLFTPGIGSGAVSMARGFQTPWEKHFWLSTETNLKCYGDEAITPERDYWSRFGWPPGLSRYACAHALNPPLKVGAKTFGFFPGPCVDCLGGADHSDGGSFTYYSWAVRGIPYDYGRTGGDDLISTKTEFVKFDDTNGIEVPAHTADGACCVSCDSGAGNIFARVTVYSDVPPNAFNSVKWEVWVRSALTAPVWIIGDDLKWRTNPNHLKGI